MKTEIFSPRQALNKAFLRVKPNRSQVEKFQTHLEQLLGSINETESEEFHKNLLADFLKHSYYSPQHFINTKGRNDLVIHNGKESRDSVGVILEVKKPSNKSEMLRRDKLNCKALQELLLYFLRERITEKNLEIKHLIATNIYEWFIFDGNIFERLFAQNQELVRQFNDFETGRLTGKTTDFFYKQIGEPFLNSRLDSLTYTHFDLREYSQTIREDEHNLISLYKIFSPEHLLKLPFANDSNSLDKNFYSELLHIIGLTEIKEGGKKLIQRLQPAARQPGSLLENAISQVESLDKISRLPNPEEFGETEEERLLNIGLELGITWINRILFLKLLEAQIIRYHRGDKSLGFLNLSKIADYDDLNRLFFSVLAKKQSERSKDIQNIYTQVPYLNSSLFEPTELEQSTIVISNLRSENLEIFAGTVLKDSQGKKRTGEINALAYLFEFLNAYDFSSEGGEAIQEDNKTLINASVLGLIFEKINGYKDGSFFTPGFITMYMCRETIRRAVIEKFNQSQGWNCQTIEDVYNRIKDKTAANAIINSLKICDPAVGSGHFLVSALNEIIAIKSELQILVDKEGKTLRDYRVEVVNDELIVTDDDGNLFEYNPRNRESQRVQETLFQEKQRLIEGCLFGVDINPNSVKICRLRLWIELLKNAYYKADNELETLPNIDINIKVGNSLISRFGLSNDLQVFSRKSRLSIESYKDAVRVYRNAEDKSQKREMERLISEIKSSFRQTLQGDNPLKKRLRGLETDLYSLENQILLFEESPKEKKARERKISQLRNEIDKLRPQLEEIESGKIYHNAFEWRFEFPEVLDDKGDFIGFDVVIGNPPYIQLSKIDSTTVKYKNYLLMRYETSGGRLNTFIFFTHLSFQILKQNGILSYIIPNTILTQEYYVFTRQFLLNKVTLSEVINFLNLPFEDAVVETVIIQYLKSQNLDYAVNYGELAESGFNFKFNISSSEIRSNIGYSFLVQRNSILLKVFESKNCPLDEICNINQAIALKGDKSLSLKTQNPEGKYKKLLDGRNINKYSISWDGFYLDYDITKIHSCKRRDIFETKEKLLFRRVSRTLIFTYDNSQYYALNTLVVVNLKKGINFDIKFLLGIMNSSLMNYIYNNKFKSTKTVFSEIQTRSISQLPIPKISQEQQQPIIVLVDQILTAKKSNPKADTSELEKEIDKIVYELYGLSEEEIRIIEGEIK
ncbi:Eco57I restriction-modification methylase domain-containing protein [Microcystis aeruginosa BLCCF108]|uniref:site-specific DNA-methyltransferase (adenine-specific) n=2 Tax=Microcystis TaxID=1125 RepID=A0A841UT10_MICAE|nr:MULTISPECIES: TaqI-like C-terminal specificity domain-containing protein [Microcystis]MBC1193308.1 Eco57I restriction-modification methylase domain-containing protein [Microcystis aeruginosa BLCC-F108]MCA2590449.1 Eco57I restriction-modification methylase domain-containing protein [Microcystis sp. M31BS1]